MPMSRTALALQAGDALSGLIAAESQGLVGDPRAARARSRASRAKVSATPRSSGSLKKLSAFRRRLPSFSLGAGSQPGSRRRRRGISAAQLRGFRRVVRLLHSIGMQPKKLRIRRKT